MISLSLHNKTQTLHLEFQHSEWVPSLYLPGSLHILPPPHSPNSTHYDLWGGGGGLFVCFRKCHVYSGFSPWRCCFLFSVCIFTPLSLSRYLFREGNGTPLQHSCLENPMDGEAWWAAVHGVAKSQTRLSDFPFTFHFPALEKEMATHSSVLAWRIPGTGEPGGLPSMGSHRVGHDWCNLAAAAAAAAADTYSSFKLRTPALLEKWLQKGTIEILSLKCMYLPMW